MLSGAEFEAWFRLLETPGLGRDGARRLLAAFGDPAAALSASPTALRAVAGPHLVAAIAVEPPEFRSRLSAARAWCDGGPHRHVVTLGDAAYPPLLLQTADPPLLLYAQGELALLAKPAIAIVGSRRPTAQGRDTARAFARELADDGLVVVSGLAQGIDSAAHEGALAGVAGTIAVVGTGLDRVYPPQNLELAHRITQRGLLLGEFAPGTPALPEHFPLRNRIIAGLSLGTLVVEAAIRSGSLITARLASEAGREVFAVPGSIHAPQARGCHWLIKQGAKLVESAADIVDELAGQRADRDDRATSTEAQASTDPLLDALGDDPVTLDALQARTGWPTHELTSRLLELELDGDVARLPGGLYQRRHAG